MENGYGLYSQGSSGWTSRKNEEFQEEDVWQVFKENKDSDSRMIMGSFKEPSIILKRHTAATRMIPKSSSSGSSSSASQQPTLFQHSAPVNIPDWSKIYGTNSNKSNRDSEEEGDGNHINHGSRGNSWESDDDEDEEDEDGCLIPPHEWIARKLARSQISSFSVCEGAGRTLKGRDLSRVRNAVLSKTGFIESKSNY